MEQRNHELSKLSREELIQLVAGLREQVDAVKRMNDFLGKRLAFLERLDRRAVDINPTFEERMHAWIYHGVLYEE